MNYVDDFNYVFFKAYGISELKEKFIVLSREEQITVLNSIKNKEENELMELIKKPFPEFIVEYYRRYYPDMLDSVHKNSECRELLGSEVLNDVAFGYKMFLMPEKCLMAVNKYVKFAAHETDYKDINNWNVHLDIAKHYLETPLEKIITIRPGCGYYKRVDSTLDTELLKKYIYIMKYFGIEEAKKLGTSSDVFYRHGEFRGFDLESKLDALNPLIRSIVKDYIGVDGYSPKTIEQLVEKYGQYGNVYKRLLTKDFLYNMALSAGQFKNKIGYVSKDYAPDERIKYTNADYKTLTDIIEAQYVQENLRTDDIMGLPYTASKSQNTRYYILKNYSECIPLLMKENGHLEKRSKSL